MPCLRLCKPLQHPVCTMLLLLVVTCYSRQFKMNFTRRAPVPTASSTYPCLSAKRLRTCQAWFTTVPKKKQGACPRSTGRSSEEAGQLDTSCVTANAKLKARISLIPLPKRSCEVSAPGRPSCQLSTIGWGRGGPKTNKNLVCGSRHDTL
jgi:hypothetical protein